MAAKSLEDAVRMLSRLPGLGPRSARRIILHLLDKRDDLYPKLITSLQDAHDKIKICTTCGNLDEQDPCLFCTDSKRNAAQICVVASASDVGAIEKTRLFTGRYHVLGGIISALDGIRPEQLRIEQLLERAKNTPNLSEVILALPATVDGQTTAHYIATLLTKQGVQTTRLAHGMPMGGELDYLDGATLAAALKNRKVSA